MTTPLISVVIAIYNIEDFFEPCLKSVLCQTYKDVEILAIDDGSTDGSLDILKKYVKNNPNLKIIHQKNAGLSAVRNLGLKKARGEYICFIDGDDTIAPDYLAKLYSSISKADADISVCGYTYIEKSSRRDFLPKPEVISGRDATVHLLIDQENLDIVAWNKMYKRELFLKNRITYPVGEPHEDNLTTYKLYSAARKVALLDQPLYYYQERSGSIMNRSKILNRLNYRARAAREAIKYFTKDQSLKSAAEISLLTSCFAYLDSAIKGEIPASYIEKSLSWIITHAPSYRANPHLTPKLRLYLWLTTHLNAKPYLVFRKLSH